MDANQIKKLINDSLTKQEENMKIFIGGRSHMTLIHEQLTKITERLDTICTRLDTIERQE